MSLKKSVAAIVAIVVLGVGMGACSSAEADTGVTHSHLQKSLISKTEPDEERDVTNLRFVKEPGDGTYVFAACTITNHSQEMSDYLIEVEAIYPDPSFASKKATIRAAHVPPGAKVPCTRGSFLADFNPKEWELHVVKIDRIATVQKDTFPDEQMSSDYLDLRHGQAGSAVNFSLTNYAEQMSNFVVRYEIPDANGIGVFRDSYELKGLEYLENRTGSVPVPQEVINKLKASLDYGEKLEDLTQVRLLDVDRTPYEG